MRAVALSFSIISILTGAVTLYQHRAPATDEEILT
jgi:hypothetical protein